MPGPAQGILACAGNQLSFPGHFLPDPLFTPSDSLPLTVWKGLVAEVGGGGKEARKQFYSAFCSVHLLASQRPRAQQLEGEKKGREGRRGNGRAITSVSKRACHPHCYPHACLTRPLPSCRGWPGWGSGASGLGLTEVGWRLRVLGLQQILNLTMHTISKGPQTARKSKELISL